MTDTSNALRYGPAFAGAPGRGLVMTRRHAIIGLSVLGGGLVVPGAAIANPVKTGTVDIEQVQIAFLASGHLGGGTLHFGGKAYAFSIGGLGIGGIGISKMQAYGDVYDLTNLAHFTGAYGQTRSGFAVGDQGRGQLSLQNEHNVIMHLRSRREGLALSLGADAVFVNFK